MLERFDSLRKKLLAPFVWKINPNYITALAFVAALIAGFAFWQGALALGGLAVLLNGFFDALDGEIARKFGQSKFGDFLDHTLDRLADVVIFIGLALNPLIPIWLGLGGAITTLLVSYLGTQAHALIGKRVYTAIIGRADRLLLLGIGGIVGQFNPIVLYWILVIIIVLCSAAFVQRALIISQKLRKSF